MQGYQSMHACMHSCDCLMSDDDNNNNNNNNDDGEKKGEEEEEIDSDII